MTNKFFEEKGFSLLEILIAVAIAGGLSLVLLELNRTQLKQQKTIELKGDISQMLNMIRQTLNNEESCNATFIGTNFTDKNIVKELRSTKDFSQLPFAQIGEVKFQNFDVYIKDMRLLTRPEEVAMGINNNISVLNGFGRATLRITFVKNPGVINPASTSREFFGAKETIEYLPIHGYFYNESTIESTSPTALAKACQDLAQTNLVTGCDLTSSPAPANNPCSWTEIPGKTTSNTGVTKYQALCKFYKQDSPIQQCVSTP